MIIFALETSSAQASLCIARDKSIMASTKSPQRGSHSEWVTNALLPLLQRAELQLHDIDLFAVGTGPGSFTGLRVGINIVKTLAYVHNKPVFATDSLSILAQNVSPTENNRLIVLTNAFRNQVFYAIFHSMDEKWQCMKPPSVCDPSQLNEFVQSPHVCIGNGYELFEDQYSPQVKANLDYRSGLCAFPQADQLVQIAFDCRIEYSTIDWKSVQPLYVRASAAEEKHGSPSNKVKHEV